MLSGDTPVHQRLFPYRNRDEYLLSIEAYGMLQENPYSEEWSDDVREWYEQSIAVQRAQRESRDDCCGGGGYGRKRQGRCST